eukprot:m.143585 g.143585  ORF g.143585 m.143585 type:complete len:92 (-) comp16020_c2_seq3:54-329(-)
MAVLPMYARCTALTASDTRRRRVSRSSANNSADFWSGSLIPSDRSIDARRTSMAVDGHSNRSNGIAAGRSFVSAVDSDNDSDIDTVAAAAG